MCLSLSFITVSFSVSSSVIVSASASDSVIVTALASASAYINPYQVSSESERVVVLQQSGAAAMYTSDHHGDEGQCRLPAGQWPHHGPVARPHHPSSLHATGTKLPTVFALLLLACMQQ